MKSNWSNAARRMRKYQFGLMLALVGSTVTMSPAQADLDEKSKVIAEWLVNFTLNTSRSHHSSSTHHDANHFSVAGRLGCCACRTSRLDTNYSGRPRGPHQRKFQR